jgi:hypothetical protein
MRKTILALLRAVLVATPCFAQEVETDGLFSLNGTRWWCYRPVITFSHTPPNPPSIGIKVDNWEIGFYKGEVYFCDEEYGCGSPHPSYLSISTPVLGICFDLRIWGTDLYIMQPTAGIGLTTLMAGSRMRNSRLGYFGIGIMIKVANNWKPPDVE